MKTVKTLGLGVAAGAGVAALTYGGIATRGWLRYGKRQLLPSTMLARYLPDPEVSERHRLVVDAPADVTFLTACNLDALQSRIVRLIFGTRALLMRTSKSERELPRPLLDQAKALGWGVLEETPGREIAFGAVCQPWHGDVVFRTVPPEEFAAFAEPGYAKIAWNVSVEPLGERRCLVRTETRVSTTDAAARKRFRRYWALVNPGIKIIRREMLKLIKRQAERIA